MAAPKIHVIAVAAQELTGGHFRQARTSQVQATVTLVTQDNYSPFRALEALHMITGAVTVSLIPR